MLIFNLDNHPMNRYKLVCITPIKNESWILEKFLTVTSLWADHIILADQGSTDDSVKIAERFDKVIVVNNELPYNEFERTKILLSEARAIEGDKIIFALDADEIFTANYADSPEWLTLQKLKKGDVILMDRVNINAEHDTYFGKLKMMFGLVDDGISTIEATSQAIIHNIRLPWPANSNSYHFKEIKVIHFDYVIQERTLSKLIWYQCFEKMKFNHDDRYLLRKYRTFKTIEEYLSSVPTFQPKPEWFEGYKQKKIDLTSLKTPFLWWNNDVIKMMEEHGIRKFIYLDIHRIDWVKTAKEIGHHNPTMFYLKRPFQHRVMSKLKAIWGRK